MTFLTYSKNMLFVLLGCCLFYSCEKDDWTKEQVAVQDIQGQLAYDQFGRKLEQAISSAIENPVFKEAVITTTKRMEDGDYEVLLASLLNERDEVRTTLLTSAATLFTAEELDDFLAKYPSMILAVRGPYDTWETSQHTPAVVFVPSLFKESDPEITGTQKGESVQVPLDKPFTEAVLALRISERHDRMGVLVEDESDYNFRQNDDLLRKGKKPSVDLSGEDALKVLSCSEPEPTMCPDEPADLSFFNVATFNGGFHLTYGFNNTDPIYECGWFHIKIRRLNPDGTITTFVRNGTMAQDFYDFNVNPNLTYVYQIEAYVAYIAGGTLNNPDWETCPSVSAIASQNSASAGPPVNTFRGQNFSSSQIYYSWSPPQAGSQTVPVFEYKLSYWNGSQFLQEVILPGSATEHVFDYPNSDRGQKVRMMIQYRAGGGAFQGNFQDITYGSFRNDGMPLYFLGINLHSASAYEESDYGESPINGNPELRIVAYQGGAGNSTQLIKNVVRSTYRCPNSNFYRPTISVNITDWQRDLIASGIKVRISETDVMDAVVTGSNTTNTFSASFEANVGLKVPFGGSDSIGSVEASIGYQSSWQNGNSITYAYPTSDIPLGVFPIFYHEPLVIQRGNVLFSTQNNPCEEASKHYRGRLF